MWAGGKKPARAPDRPSVSAPPAVSPAAVKPAGLPPVSNEPVAPVYLTEMANPNDFVLFANGGGWDGNWYVGYNTCWVSKLPVPPAGNYARAFLGAKIGRMKTEPVPGRPPWEKRPIRGEIDMAVAPEPLWPQSRRFLLTETQDIPLEGDGENAIEGVGESRWFWVEVPLKFISPDKENYVALYSPSAALTDSRHAPVLAAGWGDTRQNTWLNSTVKGEPPFTREDTLKTPVTYFEPAIAMKLVPANDHAVQVALINAPPPQTVLEDKLFLSAAVRGENIERAWVEFSTDTKTWRHASSPVFNAPYIFTVKSGSLLVGSNSIRVAAVDILENKGVSEAVPVVVPPPSPQKKKVR